MGVSVIGSWDLISFQIEDLNQQTKSWGQNTTGLLIYSPDGHMSVSINREVEKRSDQEFKNLFDSILFYSGTYVVEGDIIRHQVTQASNPSRIGKTLIRYASHKDDLLTLKSPVESFGQATLVWRKIK
jgi:hypothetical protein